jgi:hypothetical protein
MLMLVVLLVSSSDVTASQVECKKVGDDTVIAIDPAALKELAQISVGRKQVFDSMIDTSIPETNGCWAGASGNFDGQLLSLGIAQWNFGQGSLQPLMRAYKRKLSTNGTFEENVAKVMPDYWRITFSSGCIDHKEVTKECQEKILSLQNNGRLIPQFKAELSTLLETKEMIQIQTDQYVRLITRVQSDLIRLFPNRMPSVRQIKWAIDTKVQQGSFPADSNVTRIREKILKAKAAGKTKSIASLITWYEGLCTSIDQDGVRLDCDWNVERWRKLLLSLTVTDEQVDLLHLSHVRSRVANNEGGLYQALTFQRRATIVLGVGSISGRRVDVRTD